jgi:lysozyme family protein
VTNFEAAVALVLKLEGGYVNHPHDQGGPTKYGITLRMLTHHRQAVVSFKDVENLTEKEASDIYLENFWNHARLGNVPQKKVAMVLFAHIVHTGPLSAIKALQKTLNLHFGQMLFIDGVFGSRTEIALSNVTDEDLLCRKLIQTMQLYYLECCENKSSNMVFLKGWLNRSFAVWDAVS